MATGVISGVVLGQTGNFVNLYRNARTLVKIKEDDGKVLKLKAPDLEKAKILGSGDEESEWIIEIKRGRLERRWEGTEAVRMANDTNYGLSAAVFTQDIDRALKFARNVDSGNIHVNWGTVWRADNMPYGGLKESGTGKEGPKYAVEEMTEMKTVVIHGGGGDL